MKLTALILLTAACAACAAPPPTDQAATSSGDATGATVHGVVTLAGERPPQESIRLDADPQCLAIAGQSARSTEDVVIGDGGGLANVFVYIKDGLPADREYPVPDQPVVLDQQQCRYLPRVLGVQVGQALILRNSDPLLHTVRADAVDNARFNIGTPVQGMEVRRSFQRPEVMVPVKCDMHPWMHAYVGVVAHPYFAVTDASGQFAIAGLPPGTYRVGMWHERLGEREHEVAVAAGGIATVAITFEGPPR